MIRSIVFPFALILFLTNALGQSFRVQLQSEEVEAGKPFQVAFVASSDDVSQPQFPSFDRLVVLSGPRAEQEMVNVGGSLSTQTVYRFELQASKPGTYLIGTATAVVEGEVVYTNSLELRVVAPQPELSPEDQALRRALERSLSQNISLEATLSDRRVYVGEPVDLTYDLWIDAQLSSQVGSISREGTPQFPGFSATPIPIKNERTLEIRQGKRFLKTRVSAYRLIAQTPGTFSMDSLPLGMTVAIPRATRTPQNDLEAFQRQFQPNFREYRYTIVSARPKLEVLPLPATDRPVDFSGLVGTLTLRTELTRNSLQTGQEAQLILTFDGDADFGLLTPPALLLPPGMEAYPPTVVPPTAGTGRIITYPFVARNPGSFSIPTPQLSFFNPSTRTYQQLGGDTLLVTVTGEALSAAIAQEDDSGANAAFDKTFFPHKTGLRAQAEAWIHTGFWEVMLLPWLLMIPVLLLYRQQQRRLRDPQYQRQRAFKKALAEQLRLAQQAFQQNRPKDGHAALLAALWVLLEDRLDLRPEAQTNDQLRAALAAATWSTAEQERLLGLLFRCRAGAYGHQVSVADKQLLADVTAFMEVAPPRPPLVVAEETQFPVLATLLICCSLVGSLSAQTSWDQAAAAYRQADYARSARIYDSLYRSGERSIDLFQNWGNAAYQNGALGRAVWAYEKGLRYEPASRLTQQNLAFVRKDVRSDILPRPELALERSWREGIGRVGPAGWSWLAVWLSLSLALVVAGSLWWPKLRRFRTPLLLSGGALLAICLWLRVSSDPERPNGQAIILSATVVREAPEGQRELLLLVPGVKVYTGEVVSGWREIRVQDPESGELVGYVPTGLVGEL
ncbi:MAG: BatD family protein [Bacteroidia bacterium]|nr:BatD family protein [Bacteroidia bacterium]